ncbi:MAG: DUF4469 domain-containing protein [Prevotellaceae bacterium]|nr:DUF4469 domain-containing protein [Prevotellaceae bacterium]
MQNRPLTVFALIPVLPAGNYRVKTVTQFSHNRDLKDPGATVYGKILQVQ